MTPPPASPPALTPLSRGFEQSRPFTSVPDDHPTMRVPVFGHPLTSATPPPAGSRRLTGLAPSGGLVEDLDPAAGPGVGETYQGFELVEELGQGAFARVFLARQKGLAGRLVALKVTRNPTREAERLARLQHTNIVPVYSVHDAPPAQVICMPFLGRVTLADLVRNHRTNGTRATRQAKTTQVGDRPGAKGPEPAAAAAAAPRPAADSPAFVGDPDGVLRVLARLAAGLAHAHDRGILHLDLKPANVLIADDGEPMLLDFNLSFDTTVPDRDLVGGTVAYMAPEQMLDFKSRGRGGVDARADLYSLGVMAFELLTGEVPFPVPPSFPGLSPLSNVDDLLAARRQGPPSVRTRNPAVSPAVEAIVNKLLAPDPRDRYQTAEDLRTDVRRQLGDLPLAFAREGSVRERLGKWRRRNPKLPGRLLAAGLCGLVLGLGTVAHIRAETVALYPVQLDLVIPGDPAARARGLAKADELLAAYGLPDDADWAKRPAVRHLPEAERADLAGDLGELALLTAWARWEQAEHAAPDERKAAAATALELTRAARTCFPAGEAPGVLDELAGELASAAGEEQDPAARAAGRPETARDRFLAAAFAVARGRYETAERQIEQVTADQPGHAAAQFAMAYCRRAAGHYERALERYDAARVLLPNDPRPAYQRGLIYTQTGRPEKAEAEFTKALSLDPEHAAAYRYRGLARLHLKKFREAEADFTAALARGTSPAQVHSLRADARQALRDTAGEAADRRAAAELEPRSEGDYLVRGCMRVKADPKGALADFEKASRLNPRSLAAVHNQAHVLADKLNEPEAALDAMDRAVRMYPEFAPARVGRAVVLARLGRRDEAHAEVEKAVQLSDDPQVTYQAACVFALTSKTHLADAKRAIQLLRKALRDGFTDLRTLASDPDLNPIRSDAEFRALRDAAVALLR